MKHHYWIQVQPLYDDDRGRWMWNLMSYATVTFKNGFGFADSAENALHFAKQAAERERFIEHNPNENEDCDCLMCSNPDDIGV